jgi:hypothetical protein
MENGSRPSSAYLVRINRELFWVRLDGSNIGLVRQTLDRRWQAILGEFGQRSAAVAALVAVAGGDEAAA